MTYSNFQSQILTSLSALDGIRAVYGYEAEDISGFPCVTVTPTTSSEKILDTARSEREYRFRVLLFDDIASNEDTRAQVESRMMGLADTVLSTLEAIDFSSVGGMLSSVQNGGFQYMQRQSGALRAFEVTIAIRQIVARG